MGFDGVMFPDGSTVLSINSIIIVGSTVVVV